MVELNPAQQQAVTAVQGNLLVLAGAGSGKTRVLVERILWSINEWGLEPREIMAVTFTNKAAKEMRSRLANSLQQGFRDMWVGTFHGIAHQLMRLHWRECNISREFQIMDSDEQLRLVKRIFREKNIDEERFEPKSAQNYINRKKDEGQRANNVNDINLSYNRVLQEIYLEYENRCRQNNLIDFAELLLKTYELFNTNTELLSHYQNRFGHFLVDEFQDTNSIQYLFLKKLCGQAKAVTIVGDDDQSIYGWRGAKIENIHKFQRDFPSVNITRLEQNYRSTGTILAAANAVIKNNCSRMAKELWTNATSGKPIDVYHALNEDDEALYICRNIEKLRQNEINFRDIAILYRSNAQSRVIEDILVRSGIPYSIYGGVRFFERQEIKDLLAYLRLALNPQDATAFERAVNTPPRGVGRQSIEAIRRLAAEQDLPLWDAAIDASTSGGITGRAKAGVLTFINIIEELKTNITKLNLAELIQLTLDISGLHKFFREQTNEQALSRAENLEELVNATKDYINESWEELDPNPENQLLEFLSYAALDGGEWQASDSGGVQLMTLHSAKGLEFPVVFMCGLEEGLFPHYLTVNDPNGIEEERRLCYVGITRAMQQLFISKADNRRLFGRSESRRSSRFLVEIPNDLITENSKRNQTYASIRTTNNRGNSSAKSYSKATANYGTRVQHAKFGYGTIVEQEGSGDKARIKVNFDKVGAKWLIAAYAKLTPA